MSDFINYSGKSLDAAKSFKVSNNDADYKDLSVDDIKKKLKLFEEKSANNATDSDKTALSAQQTTLQAQKDNLEKQMGELQEEISQKEEEAQEHSDKITKYISTTKSKSKEYSKRVENVTNDAVKQALNDYKQGNIGKAEVATRIQSYIKMSNLSTSDMDLVIDLMNTEQETVKELARQLTNITDKIGILKIKYTSVSSVYKVVSNTLNQIGKTSTSYSNSDYNTQAPIYTTDKALDITDLATKYSTLATNTAKTEGGSGSSSNLTYEDKISGLVNKYRDELNAAKNNTTTGSSSSGSSNDSLNWSNGSNSTDDNIEPWTGIEPIAENGYTTSPAINNIRTVTTNDDYIIDDMAYSTPRSNSTSSNIEAKNEYSSSNPAISQLANLMSNSEFVSDLKNAGLTQSEMSQFFAEYFSGAYVSHDKSTNTLTSPNGMDSKSKMAFSTMKNLISSAKTTSFKGELDTSSNAGNTIDTNEQLKTLSENYDEILSGLKNKGYTFKEAMYALFGKNNANNYKGIFSDCGINYDLTSQSQNNANYSFAPAGDEKTAQLYEDMASKINELWGVKADNIQGSVSFKQNQGEKDKIDEINNANRPSQTPSTTTSSSTGSSSSSSSSSSKKDNSAAGAIIGAIAGVALGILAALFLDPVGFKYGDEEYLFVTDRNKDGKFDGANEFVGADKNSNWVQDLLEYDEDGDGILSQEELKKVMLLGTKTTTEGKDTSSKDGRDAIDTNNVKVKYSSKSAYELGIESIDLRKFLNPDGTVNTDLINKKTGQDVNGSQLYEDSISFNIKGEEITATRKDDTAEYLDTMYGDAVGRSNELGGLDVDSIISEALNEFNMGFSESGLEAIGIVKNASNIYQELVDYKQKTESEAKDYMEAKKQKAADKAYNDQNKGSWSSMEQKVMLMAQQLFNGSIPDDFMDQAKSYYERRGATMSASELASAVKDMYDKIDEFEEGNKTESSRDKALDFIVEAHKKGFDNNISVSEAENAIKKGMEVEDFIKSKQ